MRPFNFFKRTYRRDETILDIRQVKLKRGLQKYKKRKMMYKGNSVITTDYIKNRQNK